MVCELAGCLTEAQVATNWRLRRVAVDRGVEGKLPGQLPARTLSLDETERRTLSTPDSCAGPRNFSRVLKPRLSGVSGSSRATIIRRQRNTFRARDGSRPSVSSSRGGSPLQPDRVVREKIRPHGTSPDFLGHLPLLAFCPVERLPACACNVRKHV